MADQLKLAAMCRRAGEIIKKSFESYYSPPLYTSHPIVLSFVYSKILFLYIRLTCNKLCSWGTILKKLFWLCMGL